MRLLLIEDSDARVAQFRSWLPESIVLVIAAPVPVVRLVFRSIDFAGILLDHGPHQQAVNPHETLFTGSDVANILARKISREIPVLVHSINPAGAWDIQRKLESTEFVVSLHPVPMLAAGQFGIWLRECECIIRKSKLFLTLLYLYCGTVNYRMTG